MQTSDGYITIEEGIRLYFQKTGSGPALVILNGLYWFEDFQYLSASRTLIGLDLRHRGRSDFVSDSSKLKRGIQQDVDDLETVRNYFELDQMDLLAHSYAGMIPVLYALKHPARVHRIVQMSSIAPDSSKQYPAHLMNADATLREALTAIQELEKERSSTDPVVFCRKFWSLLRIIYVGNPADVAKIKWDLCSLPAERNLMSYWLESLFPSIQAVKLRAEDLAEVNAPVLVVHGTRDRSSPYGGARDWARILPNARLLTIEEAAHVPWIEAPGKVLAPIEEFLGGSWPTTAQQVDLLET